MRQLRIGDVTIDAVIERCGPWRRPQDCFSAYDEAIFRRHLPTMEPEVFDAAPGIGFHQIDYVFCTHLHMGHTGWNTSLRDGRWVPTFPNAILEAEFNGL